MKGKLKTLILAAVTIFVLTVAGGCGVGDDGGDAVKVGLSYIEDVSNETEYGEDLQAYVDAVEQAGGEPVVLPLIENEEQAQEALDSIDCLIMTGGEDIDPAQYGEQPGEMLEELNKARDVSDKLLLSAALDDDMPILCTCRGMQLLNVVYGGTLYQDIPTDLPESEIKHREPEEIDFTYHDLENIKSDSVLAGLLGDNISVNSWHHQAIKTVGEGLVITAESGDGIIEGLEDPEKTYLVGVQFHPEWMVVDGYDEFLVFFTDLMEKGSEFAENR